MMCVFPVIDNSTLKYLVSLLKICMPVLVISHKNDLNKQLSDCSMIAFDNAIDKCQQNDEKTTNNFITYGL